MKKIILASLLIGGISQQVQAHKRWVLPSIFNVSEPQWVAVDATVSNNIFYPDRPWSLDNIRVNTPEGKAGVIENKYTGHRRSTFDVHLGQPGTYEIISQGTGYFASYDKVNPKKGERPQERKRGQNLAELKTQLPENAKNLTISQSDSKMVSYVTVGAPSFGVFKLTNKGIEMQPETHPNDLYQGEQASFVFLVDGQAIEGLEVLMVWEGTRYRNSENETTFKTDVQGKVKLPLSQSGRFLLEISHKEDVNFDNGISVKYASYLATFEVLPQ
ncbi:DUF4198 domain-containing protein [Marinicella rhabdoformis]|uniref:DUF4198 domain-containing protein n=1 Tax=Marinicella rhabdoformis TaxID=2580566 RepID=UPI0012AEDCB6|nr:DUF4198 domain-containing protein [Marinicella rhabdoformis]